MAERVLDFFESAAHLTAAYLTHGVDLGSMRADLDVDGTARAVNGMILSLAIAMLRHPEPADQRRLSEAALRVMYDGIAAHAVP
ncbi:hypothetical protein [Actinocorallia populi]|uniref:hypothetical protein n=1 Tax=Actinocorallia populi TaxID=2079200 RepID=UPI0018E50370|nr:hypothetical protein [Actinocorallia populi]